MGKTDKGVTELLLQLKPGSSCVITRRRVVYSAAQKHAPDGRWSAERLDEGWRVTRVR